MSIEAQHAHATSQTVGTEGYFALARSRVSPAGSRAQLAPSRATVMDFQVPGAATRSVLSLESTAHLELLLDRLSGERRNVELRIGAAGSAAIYLSEGKIAWVRLDEHPENLGAVLRRELGLPMASVCEAIAHCRSTGQRFGAGLVELSMVTPDELRDCMLRHFADQLWELLDRDGPVVVEQLRASHRYDHDYTFTLSELLARPSMPSALEGQRLVALVERCQARAPRLQLACVIETEEGTVLHSGTGLDEDAAAVEDMLGLCTAGLRRLIANRITGDDGSPKAIVLSCAAGTIVVQPLGWKSNWLLVLGGRGQPGAMLAAAASATAI